jgi:hypothetical protein
MKKCILWHKGIRKDGYGDAHANGKHWLAHRLIYTRAFGEIPNGMCVLHKCDIRNCVNPQHLFLGTQKDNVRDMETKNRARHPNGEEHGRSKLSEAEVLAIRAADLSYRILAKQFGVCLAVISQIKNRQNWVHI